MPSAGFSMSFTLRLKTREQNVVLSMSLPAAGAFWGGALALFTGTIWPSTSTQTRTAPLAMVSSELTLGPPLMMASVMIEHSMVTARMASVGLDVRMVAVIRV